MAKKSKRSARYDLNKADRRRNLLIQIGLTAVVVVFAVGLVLYIVKSNADKPQAGEATPVRVSSANLITKADSDEPKVVLSIYEDFLCPACARFEQQFGPTVNQLIDAGGVATDYYALGILDRPQNQNYSSRAGGAAYCVADESQEAFRRFHSALFAQQPAEAGAAYPTNAQLVETARLAGAGGSVPDCIDRERYAKMVQGMAAATDVRATPTVRINGEEYSPSTPEALVEKVESIVGDLPGLPAPAATPTPTPEPAAP